MAEKDKKRRLPFNVTKRSAFLDSLAAGCNVRAACAAAKVSPSWAYGTRRCDPDFAADWGEAIQIGYDQIESALIAHVLAALDPADAAEAIEAARRSVEEAEDDDADDEAALALPGHAQPGSGLVRTRLSQADVQLGLLLLNRHRATAEGRGKPAMRGRRRPTAEETNAALTKKLDALARKLRRDI